MYNLQLNYMYHLDIKTANICILPNGNVYLVDLGLIVINKSDNIHVPYIETPWAQGISGNLNRKKYFKKITTKFKSIITEVEDKLNQCSI